LTTGTDSTVYLELANPEWRLHEVRHGLAVQHRGVGGVHVRVKILYWDRDGWALWAKRLEAGTYAFPFAATGRQEITAGELSALLEGIDLRGAPRRKRYLPRFQQESGGAVRKLLEPA